MIKKRLHRGYAYVKTAIRNSKINFYFVTVFYSLYDICIADGGLRPN